MGCSLLWVFGMLCVVYVVCTVCCKFSVHCVFYIVFEYCVLGMCVTVCILFVLCVIACFVFSLCVCCAHSVNVEYFGFILCVLCIVCTDILYKMAMDANTHHCDTIVYISLSSIGYAAGYERSSIFARRNEMITVTVSDTYK